MDNQRLMHYLARPRTACDEIDRLETVLDQARAERDEAAGETKRLEVQLILVAERLADGATPPTDRIDFVRTQIRFALNPAGEGDKDDTP